MQNLRFNCDGEEATREVGRHLGKHLQAGMVVGLQGTLGSGKTTLCRGLVEGLEGDPTEVVSPTFAICVPYAGRCPILHVDIYRLEHESELDELGLDEQVEWGAILLAEWPERAPRGLPPLDIRIRLKPTGSQTRLVEAEPLSDRGHRWFEILPTFPEHNSTD